MTDRLVLTSYDPPPIPARCYDWLAVLEDYKLGDPQGFGTTEQAAIRDLEKQIGTFPKH